jgi:hypothetical protein
VAFHHWGRVGPQVTIHQPGGTVSVEIGPGDEVTLSGTSERIAGIVTDGLLSAGTALAAGTAPSAGTALSAGPAQ